MTELTIILIEIYCEKKAFSLPLKHTPDFQEEYEATCLVKILISGRVL